jgi:hypothetical protein
MFVRQSACQASRLGGQRAASLSTAGRLYATAVDTDARCVLITGASSGIGLACAGVLAERGWRVALADVNEAAGRAAAADIHAMHPGSAAAFYPLDVRTGLGIPGTSFCTLSSAPLRINARPQSLA